MSDKTGKPGTGSDNRAVDDLVILNHYGMHARPAALLVKTALMFQSDITVMKDDISVSGKSIMGLMTLEAGFGSKVRVVAEGSDCREALKAITKLFEQKFFEE